MPIKILRNAGDNKEIRRIDLTRIPGIALPHCRTVADMWPAINYGLNKQENIWERNKRIEVLFYENINKRTLWDDNYD
jgi:hypothetical protein